MSESTPSIEPVTVGRDGITVTKSLLTDEFPVPTVELEIRSARTERTTVRLREYVPDGYSLESIGFHADYGSEYWTAYQDNRIEFERELEAGQSVRTIYGLRVTEDEEIMAFMGDPELVTVSGHGEDEADSPADEEIVDRDRNDALRSMLGGGDGESVEPAEEPAEKAPAEAEVSEEEPAESPEPTPVETDAPADPEPAHEEPAEPTGEPAAMPGSVAEALAQELQEGSVDAATREAISEELGLDLSRSTEARLDHLQSRVEELLAYSEPVAAFIDDGGPDRLASVEASTEDLTETLADVEQHLESVDSDHAAAIEDLEETVNTLEAQVEELEELRGTSESLEEQIDDLQAHLESIDAEVTELVQWRDQLGEMFTGGEP